MDKKFVLAIGLSLLVLMSWSAIVSKTYHLDSKDVAVKQSTEPALSTPSGVSTQVQVPQESKPVDEPTLEYQQDGVVINFLESQAAIKDIVFKDYQNSKFHLKLGLFMNDGSKGFKYEKGRNSEAVFVEKDKNKKIIKRFIFSNTKYSMMLEVNVQSESQTPITFNIPLLLGAQSYSGNNAQYQDAMIADQNKNSHLNPRKNQEFANIKFIGLRDRYFCAIIEPESQHYTGYTKKIDAQDAEIGLISQPITLNPGQQLTEKFHIYLGPQQLKLINSVNPNWSAIIHFGTFDIIAQVLLQVLDFLNKLFHNWGWSIVALSILVYLVLFPLSLKQMRSMKEMQAVQPKVEALRKLYKDNPQKLNKEIMELYREHKVNPFGGCLPLLLQMPIFFALYQALMRSVALKGASFLWIKDLSEPDRLFLLPNALPILGNEINILPIVMAIGMFIQQKMTMVKGSDSAAEQQKIMLIIFPVMFGFIFYHMPSGLVLYWLINSMLMLVYQLRMAKSK
jgi:YidC/Oxa1 family membrane protein insertase